MCDCYTIGGPWIAEDPDCPEHGTDSKIRRTQAESLIDEIDNTDLFDLSPNSDVTKLLTDIRDFLSTVQEQIMKVYFVLSFIPLLIITLITVICFYIVNFRRVTFLQLIEQEIKEIKIVHAIVFKNN